MTATWVIVGCAVAVVGLPLVSPTFRKWAALQLGKVVWTVALVGLIVTGVGKFWLLPTIDHEVAQVTKPVTDLKNSADNLKKTVTGVVPTSVPHLAVPSALTDLAKKAGVP